MRLARLALARPIGTALLAVGLVLAGLAALAGLPVSALPLVEFPVILVQAQLPGAGAATAASALAAPLERRLGQIAGVNEMTSQSVAGGTRITLQFGLDRDIDGAARDVQAAIAAARADMPAGLPFNPTYRKVNPAEQPLLILALTSTARTPERIYDAAASVLQQRLSQLPGVGLVEISGSALPAVRVTLNPQALASLGVTLEDVRAALAAANPHMPQGEIADQHLRWQIAAGAGPRRAADFAPLVIALRHGTPVRLRDVAAVTDSVQDRRVEGIANGRPAVLVNISRVPRANLIATVDRVRAALPDLARALPADIDMAVAADTSTTIRAAMTEAVRALILAAVLVFGVVALFLRAPRAALVPVLAMGVSLTGSFAGMALLGYGLDTLSVMALTIATGFVVDDAIVVLEAITRHVEAGMAPRRAVLRGTGEVAFTVTAMSVALVAVFLPLLLMGGVGGRLFREFAVTLTLAVGISLLVSLTLTPLLCAWLKRPACGATGMKAAGLLARAHARLLAGALNRPGAVLLALGATLGLAAWLLQTLPREVFPHQDTGRLIGTVRADQAASFTAMQGTLAAYAAILGHDKAVSRVAGSTGGRQANAATLFVALTPRGARHDSADAVIDRLRPALAEVPGARLYLQAAQDLRAGGRLSAAEYQFVLTADTLDEVRRWATPFLAALRRDPALADVNSDLELSGLGARLDIDRLTAARLGVLPAAIDATLNDAFGQRQVGTIYGPLNQFRVVMEVDPRFAAAPQALASLRVGAPAAAGIGQPVTGAGLAGAGAKLSTAPVPMVPLGAISRVAMTPVPLAVNHDGGFPSATISFNLPAGSSLAHARRAIEAARAATGMPARVHGAFAGGAGVFSATLAGETPLILAALLTVGMILGVLYEDLLSPLTVLSALPAAAAGGLIALWLSGEKLSLIALVALLLLIGLVQKNAIMTVDAARRAERAGSAPREAILLACRQRLRPILMTSAAAFFGAVPLILAGGEGAELRRPLGLAVAGGLVAAQALTLFSIPVVHLLLARLRRGGAAQPRASLA